MKPDRRASQATIMEVALAAGVSLATVSRTCNHPEKVKPETREKIERIIKEKGYKNGYVMWPIRTAVSGKQMTPGGAFEIMDILGKEESLRRIEIGIAKLETANA